MKIFYARTLAGLPEGHVFRNVRHFNGVEDGTTSALVDGEYPVVVAALKKAGIPVEVQNVPAKIERPDPVVVKQDRDVEIPENWQSLEWTRLRRLAQTVSGSVVTSKADAVSAIEAALKERDV